MKDGQLPDEQGEVKSGQELVVPLLERCMKFTEIMEQKYIKSDVISVSISLTIGQEGQD